MTINKITISNSIFLPLPLERSSIVTVFQPNRNLINTSFTDNYKIIGVSYYNFKLYASAQIKSTAVVPLINFTLKDPVTLKQLDRRNFEVDKPGKKLSLLFQKGIDWIEIGSIKLINFGNSFYDVHDLFHEIAINPTLSFSNTAIGVQIVSEEWDVLKDNDKAIIYGSYNQELILSSPDPSPINNISITNTGIPSGGGANSGSNNENNAGNDKNNQNQTLILDNLTVLDNNFYLGN